MKHIILLAIMMVATNAFADTVGDKQLTSREYVDTELGTKQDKIPAAGKPGVAAGDTVMTYTPGGNGVIGERGIYNDASSYNANTDANKLITAAALNDTFNSLPTVETSTMICANPPTCTLWTITDDTAYDPVIVMLNALINTGGTGRCSKAFINSDVNIRTCTTAPSNYGDFGTTFTYNNETVQISGISTCSTQKGSATWAIASDQTAIQSDYESNMNVVPTYTPAGNHCYCKMTAPAESQWVYYTTSSSLTTCATSCASGCALNTQINADLRRAMFGSVQ